MKKAKIANKTTNRDRAIIKVTDVNVIFFQVKENKHMSHFIIREKKIRAMISSNLDKAHKFFYSHVRKILKELDLPSANDIFFELKELYEEFWKEFRHVNRLIIDWFALIHHEFGKRPEQYDFRKSIWNKMVLRLSMNIKLLISTNSKQRDFLNANALRDLLVQTIEDMVYVLVSSDMVYKFSPHRVGDIETRTGYGDIGTRTGYIGTYHKDKKEKNELEKIFKKPESSPRNFERKLAFDQLFEPEKRRYKYEDDYSSSDESLKINLTP